MTFNDFLRDYGLFIAFTIFFIIIILIALFLLVPRLKKTGPALATYDQSKLINLLGGEGNIIQLAARGSRLTVTVKDPKLVDVPALKKHGVDRVIVMQDKFVLLVAKEVAALFDKLP